MYLRLALYSGKGPAFDRAQKRSAAARADDADSQAGGKLQDVKSSRHNHNHAGEAAPSQVAQPSKAPSSGDLVIFFSIQV